MKYFVIRQGDVPKVLEQYFTTQIEADLDAARLNKEFEYLFFYVRSEEDIKRNGNLE
jgi:hypothetical protein